METDQEPLIPGSPQIVLPRIEVGKWFWIGLATLVTSIGFVIAAVQSWGPSTPFQSSGFLGGTSGAISFLTAHPAIGYPFLYVFGLLNPGETVAAAIVLLWIAFARPRSPDRVAFVPAVTLTAWILANVAIVIYGVFGPKAPIIGDVGLVSFAAAISLVGCASIALAARGLRRLPRAIVWATCAVAFSQDLIFQVVAGTPPALLVGSLLLGMAILAFGFEVAELSGAELFTFDDGDSARRANPIEHLRIAAQVLLGCVGIAVCLAIGFALSRGWLHRPAEFGAWFGDGFARDGLMHAAYFVASVIGSPFLWIPAATLAMWIAFWKPAHSERLLFAAATVLSAIFILPNVSEIVAQYVQSYAKTNADAMSGYPDLHAAVAIAGAVGLFIATRGLTLGWRRAGQVLSVATLAGALGGLFIVGIPLIHLVGGLLLGASGIVFAVAIARRAGIDIFARAEHDEIV